MQKKIAYLLCMALLAAIGLAPAAEAKASAAGRASEVIKAIGVMETDQGSTSSGTDIVTRSMFAQMLINLSTLKDNASSESNVTLFKDVKKTYWASGYIQTAVAQGWMSGYLDGTFKPTQGIKLQEAVYGVLKLLGYADSDFSGSKISAIMKLYGAKGLDTNISKGTADVLTVEDCVNLFYNTLNATNKTGTVYASVLGYTLEANGGISYLSLINKGIKGPVIATGAWSSQIPFTVSTANIYKDGVACSYSNIDSYDVIYYSPSFRTIWVYDDRVTGSISSINPNYTSPTSVTLGGTEYTFADTEVALRFSAMGDVKKGDVVTLLLGQDGTVVGVLSIDEYNVTVVGCVLDTGTHLIEDENGDYKNTDYVTFVDASGNEYTQDYNPDLMYLAQGSLVQMKFVDGLASISSYIMSTPAFSNFIFSSDGLSLGNRALASDVRILDLKNGTHISVGPERLAGSAISPSSILYYSLNSGGQISELILKDVTGDLDSYGIYTGITYSSSGTMGYKYIIDGKSQTLDTDSLSYLNLTEGPTGFVIYDGIVSSSYALTGVQVSSIGTNTVLSGSTKYTLADNYSVYLYLDGEYIATTFDKVKNLSKYTVMAYYDKTIATGGRVRVIIAGSK
ncbi:MAG TPA: S-layer homology domain-containing protein [Clostridiales bacterium]|nr:S-layer homology domain-containing protein [Clostridiales bacterium]